VLIHVEVCHHLVVGVMITVQNTVIVVPTKIYSVLLLSTRAWDVAVIIRQENVHVTTNAQHLVIVALINKLVVLLHSVDRALVVVDQLDLMALVIVTLNVRPLGTVVVISPATVQQLVEPVHVLVDARFLLLLSPLLWLLVSLTFPLLLCSLQQRTLVSLQQRILICFQQRILICLQQRILVCLPVPFSLHFRRQVSTSVVLTAHMEV